MKKIAIFNVGGALACFGDIDGMVFVVDLGRSKDFSPVKDFLLPLTNRRCFHRDPNKSNKYKVDQLFLSHLDHDHTSDYLEFADNFTPGYMTCPSDNLKMDAKFRVDCEKLGELTESKLSILKEMRGRTPSALNMPLKTIVPNTHLQFIYPQNVANDEDMDASYANNISLVLFLKCDDKTVLMPGDIMKEGMKYLIESNSNFKSLLSNDGVDYLVTPHHGLESAFSKVFFDTIKDRKTRLNIISEKVRVASLLESRSDVDGRYYCSDYSTGDNALGKKGVKTSLGHLVIDLESAEEDIKQFKEIDDVITEFSHY